MKTSKQDAPHFVWGDGCDGWWLVKDSKFTVIEESMPPGTFEKRHFHQLSNQFFYCLEGSLFIECMEEEVCLEAGEGMLIKAKVFHKVKNNSLEVTRFLVISCPDSHEDRVDLE